MSQYSVEALLKASGAEEFKQAFKDAEKSVSGFEKTGEKISKVGSTMTKWVTGPIVAAGGALYGLASKATSTADDIHKGSQRIGVSTDAYQELDYWASQNGMSQADMEKAVGRLNQRMGMAADGNTKYSGALEKLGVNMNDVREGTISTEDAFAQSIQSLSEMENGQEQAALASELFGTKLGREMLPALQDSALSFEDAKAMAEEFGIVMSEDSVNAGVAFNDAMDSMKRSLGNVVAEAGIELIPLFQDVLLPLIQDSLIPAFRNFMEWIGGLTEKFQSLSPETQENILKFIGIAAAIGPVLTVVGKFLKPLGTLVKTFKSVAAGVKAAGGVIALLTSPIGIAIAAIAAIIAIGVLLYKNWDTIKEYAAKLGKWISETWDKIKTWTSETWNNIKETISEAWENIKESVSNAIDNVKETVSNIWDSIKDTTSSVWDSIKDTISSTWDSIKKSVKNAIDNVKSTISKIWDNIKSTTSKVWDSIRDTISKVWDRIKTAVKNAVDNVKTTVSNVFESIRSTINNIMDRIRNIISNVWDRIKTIISNAVNNVKTTVSNVFNSLRSVVSTAFSNVRSAVTTGMNNALNAVKNFFNRFKTAGSNIVSNIASGIRSAVGKVTGAISGVVQKVRDFLPFSPAKEGPLEDMDKLNFGGTIAGSILDGEKEISKAMNRALGVPDINANSTIQHKLSGDKQPAYIVLTLGNRTFRTFVDDITDIQDADTKLEMDFGL